MLKVDHLLFCWLLRYILDLILVVVLLIFQIYRILPSFTVIDQFLNLVITANLHFWLLISFFIFHRVRLRVELPIFIDSFFKIPVVHFEKVSCEIHIINSHYFAKLHSLFQLLRVQLFKIHPYYFKKLYF